MKDLIKYMKISIVFLFFFIGCNKTTTNQELADSYNKYRDINIISCTSVMIAAGYDSIAAKETCACMMDAYYAIDPAFFDMNEEDKHNFIKENRMKVEEICDSLRNNSSPIHKKH